MDNEYPEHPSVQIMVTFGRRSTQAHVLLIYPELLAHEDIGARQVLDVRGEAICHPHDEPNDDIGRELALGRAFESLGRKLVKRANGKVKHAEDVKHGNEARMIREMQAAIEDAREALRNVRDAR